jgi:hypothetical protein
MKLRIGLLPGAFALLGIAASADQRPDDGYINSIPRPVVVGDIADSSSAQQPQPQVPAAAAPKQIQSAAQSSYLATRQVRTVSYHHHHRRSKKKSLAIVAGSAGTGAAIGALAGGPVGAGIGAIVGGTSGFIYDRLTYRH